MNARLKKGAYYLIPLLSLMFIWLSFSPSNPPSHLNEMAKDLHPLFSTSHWGMYVIDAQTGETLASHQPSHLFIPASITKIFTAALSFEQLSPSHVFHTLVTSSAPPNADGVIQGNLTLVGGADPFLDSEGLRILAQEVYDAGVRQVEGDIIANDSLFTGSPLPIHGEWEDLSTDFATELSALSINDNIASVTISPHPAGRGSPFLRKEQDVPYCEFINHAETLSRDSKLSLSIMRGLNDNTIEITGSIPAGHAPVKATFAIHAPQEYARRIFEEALLDCEISLNKNPFQQNGSQSYEIARYSSQPLSSLIRLMNKRSDNLCSNLLFRYLTQCISTHQPAFNVWDKLMHQLSIQTQEYALYDGSGLSRHNLISPLQTVKLLNYVLQTPYKEHFLASLPIAGKDGTLVQRLKEKRPDIIVRAKTGHLSGVCNLAGYIEIPPAKRLIFAIYINNATVAGKEMNQALDTLLLRLIEAESKENLKTSLNVRGKNNLAYDH